RDAEGPPMTSSVWDDTALAANREAALEERREALLRVFRPGHLIQAGRSLPEEASLDEALAQVGSDDFRWVLRRTFGSYAAEEQDALHASLTRLLTLFAARQAQLAGQIEAMRRLTLAAVTSRNGLAADEQARLQRELDNVFASG